MKKYPNKVCVIVEKSRTCKDKSISIKRTKYLIDRDNTMDILLFTIKNHITNHGNMALHVLIIDRNKRGINPILTQNVGEIYDKYKHEDGFLYMEFLLENMFSV
jgi:hypothetical protein